MRRRERRYLLIWFPPLTSKDLKIIAIGAHPELLWLREAALRNEGFDVLSTLDLKQGIAHIERGHCGVLLLCYSLPLLERKRLAESFRTNCPGRANRHDHERKSEPEFADAVVYGVDGPEALIEAIRNT